MENTIVIDKTANTLNNISAAVNLIIVAGPSIINLISSIVNSDPNKTIEEVLEESGILWDENIKNAVEALKQ
jgi:hypothetical protein